VPVAVAVPPLKVFCPLKKTFVEAALRPVKANCPTGKMPDGRPAATVRFRIPPVFCRVGSEAVVVFIQPMTVVTVVPPPGLF
jgi:hypothetical protein